MLDKRTVTNLARKIRKIRKIVARKIIETVDLAFEGFGAARRQP